MFLLFLVGAEEVHKGDGWSGALSGTASLNVRLAAEFTVAMVAATHLVLLAFTLT